MNVGDFLFGQHQGEQADEVSHACHHEDIEIDVVFHVMILLCLLFSHSPA